MEYDLVGVVGMGRFSLVFLIAFIFLISQIANPASASHHGVDNTYPTAITNYVDFSVNIDCSSPGMGGDIDHDFICDNWENSGTGLKINISGDLNPEYTYLCGAGNPDPVCPGTNMRDIYLELDWMNYHEPSSGVLDLIKTAFSNAPDPDGQGPGVAGIRLHIQNGEDPSNPIASQKGLIKINGSPFHENTMKFYTSTATNDGFYKIKENFFGTISERAADTIPPSTPLTAKRQVFHYSIIGHKQTEYPSSSGIAEISGNDLFVTLGSFGSPTSSPYEIGSVDQQAATLMHELGHNLSLRHGGSENANCKPNYISIMNYRLQFQDTFDPTRPYDFSRQKLNDLNENGLDEEVGVGSYKADGDSTVERNFSYSSASPNWDTTSATSPAPLTTASDDVDWNGGGISTANVQANIDNFSGCTNSALSTNLVGYDDWNNLNLEVSQASSNFSTGASSSDLSTGAPSEDFSGDNCLGRIFEAGETYTGPFDDIPCDSMREVENLQLDEEPINEASSGGAEMTIDIDRDYRHLNLLQIGNRIDNLFENDTRNVDSTKQTLNKFLADAIEANSHDDLEQVSNKLAELKQASNVLIYNGEKKSGLLNVVNQKIDAFAAAQYVGDHALPPADSADDVGDLKNEINGLNDKVTILNEKTDELAGNIRNLGDKTDELSGNIRNLGDKISGLSDNNSLVYLILIIIGLTVAILVTVLLTRSSKGSSYTIGGQGTSPENTTDQILRDFKQILDNAYVPKKM